MNGGPPAEPAVQFNTRLDRSDVVFTDEEAALLDAIEREQVGA